MLEHDLAKARRRHVPEMDELDVQDCGFIDIQNRVDFAETKCWQLPATGNLQLVPAPQQTTSHKLTYEHQKMNLTSLTFATTNLESGLDVFHMNANWM